MGTFLNGRIYTYNTSYSNSEEDLNSDRIAMKYTKIEKNAGSMLKTVLPNSSSTFDKTYISKGAGEYDIKATLGLNEKDSVLGYGYDVCTEKCWAYNNVKYLIKEDATLQLEDGSIITGKKILYSQKMDGESLEVNENVYDLFGYIDGNEFTMLESNVSERDENGIPTSFVWVRKGQILELESK